MDIPVVVLTHSVADGWERESDAPFVFVTEGGIEAAVAKARELAGDEASSSTAARWPSQALQAGLIEEVWHRPRPGAAGRRRPFFDHLGGPVDLEGPFSIIEGNAVTICATGSNDCQSDRASSASAGVGRPRRGGVDDQPQVAPGDGQHVAVERDPADLGVVDRLAVRDVLGDRPLLPAARRSAG